MESQNGIFGPTPRDHQPHLKTKQPNAVLMRNVQGVSNPYARAIAFTKRRNKNAKHTHIPQYAQ